MTLAILVLVLGRPLRACEVLAHLERPDAAPVALQSGEGVTPLTLLALNALVLTIPITDCMKLELQIQVDGVPWDNRRVQTLQPMAPVAFQADPESFSLVAAAMFRATDTLQHTIRVVFRVLDPERATAQDLTFRFQARAPDVGVSGSQGTSGSRSYGGS